MGKKSSADRRLAQGRAIMLRVMRKSDNAKAQAIATPGTRGSAGCGARRSEAMTPPGLFTGACISAEGFHGEEPTYTITESFQVLFLERDGIQREKTILYMKEVDEAWMLNRTNTLCLEAMFGERRRWIDKRVTLTAALVEVEDGYRLGIRVKGSPQLEDALDVHITLPYHDAYYLRLVPTRISWIRSAR